jgi:hypothetical protein
MHSPYVHSAHLAGIAADRSAAGGVAAAIGVVLCLLGFSVALMLLVTAPRRDHGAGGDADSGPEGGGGGGGGDSPSFPPPPGGEPLWWSEFERQFANYVNSTVRR